MKSSNENTTISENKFFEDVAKLDEKAYRKKEYPTEKDISSFETSLNNNFDFQFSSFYAIVSLGNPLICHFSVNF